MLYTATVILMRERRGGGYQPDTASNEEKHTAFIANLNEAVNSTKKRWNYKTLTAGGYFKRTVYGYTQNRQLLSTHQKNIPGMVIQISSFPKACLWERLCIMLKIIQNRAMKTFQKNKKI